MKKFPKILIIALFLILAIVQADKKFVLDEIDFPIVAKATSETGIPIYYRGEEQPYHIGIYHPTLYINALALFIKLFGYNENVIRVFGMLCVLITATICIYIYREFYKQKSETFEVIFLALFLLNPYTIANSTLPDIDSTVMPVTIALFFLYTIKLFQQQKNLQNNTDDFLQHFSRWSRIGNLPAEVRETSCLSGTVVKNAVNRKFIDKIMILSLLFSLCLWGKLTTTLLLPIFLISFLFILGKNIKSSLFISALVISIGGLTFLLTYWVYCKIINLPYSYTFMFLLDSFTKGTKGSSVINKILSNISYGNQFVYWLTIPVTFLIVFGIAYLIFKARKKEDLFFIMLGLFGLFVNIFYLCLISPFSGFFKYPFPGFPFLLMPISLLSLQFYNLEKLKNKILLIIGAISFYSLFYTDNHLLEHKAFNLTILLVILGVVMSFVIVKFNNKRLTTTILSTLLFLSISSCLGVSRSQALAKYPTKYYYGQTGMEETIDYLKGVLTKDEAIWSMKDIGYYVNNKYVENYLYFFDKELQEKLILMINEGKVRYYVTTVGIGEDRIDAYPEIREIFDSKCRIPKGFGNFVVYNCSK